MNELRGAGVNTCTSSHSNNLYLHLNTPLDVKNIPYFGVVPYKITKMIKILRHGMETSQKIKRAVEIKKREVDFD